MKNVTKKMISAVLILSLLLSYGSFVQAKAAIKLSKSTATLEVGEKTTLTLKDAKGKKIKASKVKWSSTNKKIAKVSKKGVVTGVKAGTAKVTAKYKAKKYTCKITVKAEPPADEKCFWCDGSGLCDWCDGTGEDEWGGDICLWCNGTGICRDCNGTGIEQDEDWPDDDWPTDNPPADDSPTDNPPADDSPTDTPPADDSPTDNPPADDKPGSGYSVKASDGTTITAERGQTAIHSYQSYTGKSRSNIKLPLPNFESYTGGDFVVYPEEKYQDQWSMGFSYEGLNGYTPVPCYRTDYVMPFGGIKCLDDYIAMLAGLGFKVVEEKSFGLSIEYFLRYQGSESITGDICCTYEPMIGKCINYDMYISWGESVLSNATVISFEYPVEMGFEMDSVNAIAQDTCVDSTYFAAPSRTFFASGGNMTVGEYIDIEVNQSKLKKGAVFTRSDLAKESGKENGDCKLVLKNTYRLGDRTNLYPSDDKVEDAEIKVLAADSNNVAFYFKLKFVGRDHTYVFEGIASGVPPADISSGTVTVPGSFTPSNVCSKCYGKKLCPVCHGKKRYSYINWSNNTTGYVDCAGCKGTGKCWKCNGTGK